MNLTDRIRHEAHELGFDLAGVAPALPPPDVDAYRAWLAAGHHGEMHYLARPDRLERREDPARIVENVRSVICVGLNYYPGPLPARSPADTPRGVVSRYALGSDYHDVVAARLEQLAALVRAETYDGAGLRAYVDTGPIPERAYAARAGLGFAGKNTCLIHPRMGSWLFLGELLLDVELEPTGPGTTVNCGACTRCLQACPTGALVAPHVLDARRCISYLTIELKGAIPHDLRPLLGGHVFGCDHCQEVCPFQRFARRTQEPAFVPADPDRATPPLYDLLAMDEDAFRRRYAGTPILRTGRARLLRNAAVALGNRRDRRDVPALAGALADPEPLVRAHAAWALGCIDGAAAGDVLKQARETEQDPMVQNEIARAIGGGDP